jgi:dTDP-4-dehydrorhamnose reductase
MKKVLVIGSKGMAGHIIYQSLSLLGDYDVYGVARNVVQTERVFNLDISDTEALKKIIDLQFDVVINCIGVLNKDAEDNPDKAIWFNSYFPHLLEALTKNTETKIIHISTDCVFSGKKGRYTETDTKDGGGFYAESKGLGEINNFKDLTIRTSIIGPELNTNGIGLFNWFMHQTGEIKGYSSAVWSGVTTLELAKAIDFAIQNPVCGLVHLTNGIEINKFDLVSLFKEIWNRKDISIVADQGKVVNKSLLKSEVFNYQVPSYKEMLLEQLNWMKESANLYNY